MLIGNGKGRLIAEVKEEREKKNLLETNRKEEARKRLYHLHANTQRLHFQLHAKIANRKDPYITKTSSRNIHAKETIVINYLHAKEGPVSKGGSCKQRRF